jgi:quercetin dioxygenase-like cupin family protein
MQQHIKVWTPRLILVEMLGFSRFGVWFAGTRVIVRVTAAQSGGRIGVWESEEPKGTALPFHVHGREDEQVIVLAGTVSSFVGEFVHHLQAGDTLSLPTGVPHAHLVTSETARVLTIATPGGFEQLFLDAGVPNRQQAETAFDRASLVAAVEQFGVKIVGPPPSLGEMQG